MSSMEGSRERGVSGWSILSCAVKAEVEELEELESIWHVAQCPGQGVTNNDLNDNVMADFSSKMSLTYEACRQLNESKQQLGASAVLALRYTSEQAIPSFLGVLKASLQKSLS